jgi:Protein of unknown function (DUF3037)
MNNNNQAVCNYALLQFLPYPETGEFVNVGILVNCTQPCLLRFCAEKAMPARVKAMFPREDGQAYADAMAAVQAGMERAASNLCDPKTGQQVFGELVRRRESIFRFGEVRTILTHKPRELAEELFARYVRMESASPAPPEQPSLVMA